MESDTATVDGSVTEASATPDSTPVDSSVQATPEVSATPAENGSAQADSQTEAGSGSLTPDTETKQPTYSQADFSNLEKRWKDTQSAYTKERQRALDLEKRHQALEQQWQEAQKKEQAKNLPEWNPQHPSNAQFKQLLARQDDLQRWYTQAKTPEEQAFVERTFNTEFPTEVAAKLKSYRDHLSNQSREFLTDPQAAVQRYIQEHVPQIVQSHMGQAAQSYQQTVQAQEAIKPWFSDKGNEAIIQSQGDWMYQELSKPGANWDYVRASAEARYFRSQVSGAQLAAASADEKERLLKSNASGVVASSPKTPAGNDPNKIAESRGIKFGTPQYWAFLTEFSQTHKK